MKSDKVFWKTSFFLSSRCSDLKQRKKEIFNYRKFFFFFLIIIVRLFITSQIICEARQRFFLAMFFKHFKQWEKFFSKYWKEISCCFSNNLFKLTEEKIFFSLQWSIDSPWHVEIANGIRSKKIWTNVEMKIKRDFETYRCFTLL